MAEFMNTVFDMHETWGQEYDVAHRIIARTYITGQSDLEWWKSEIKDERIREGLATIVKEMTGQLGPPKDGKGKVVIDFMLCTAHLREFINPRLPSAPAKDVVNIFGNDDASLEWVLTGDKKKPKFRQEQGGNKAKAEESSAGKCAIRWLIAPTNILIRRDEIDKLGGKEAGKQFLDKHPWRCDTIIVWRKESSEGVFQGPFVTASHFVANRESGWKKEKPAKEFDLSFK
jgi:hypothetical protein